MLHYWQRKQLNATNGCFNPVCSVWSCSFLFVSFNSNGDILIQESTYGTHIHEKREERESRFTALVQDIVNRGGRCLIPVFALGRAQELLLILGKYIVLTLCIEAVGSLKLLISIYKITCLSQLELFI